MNKQGGKVGQKQFAFDITERKRAEKALKESEIEFRMLFETMTQGVIYQNAEGHIVYANPAAERILGLTLAQMQGRTSMDPRWKAVHEDGSDFPGDTHPIMIALKTGNEVRNVIMGVFHPGGNEYVWININAMPQFKPGNTKPYQVYATFEDITARKRTEEALRESEGRYRELFESINNGVAVYEVIGNGQDFIFKEFNRAGEKIDHDQRERLIGKSIFDVRPGAEQLGLIEVFRQVWQTGKPAYHPASLYQDNRLIGWYENYIYRLPPGEIVAVFEDVTKRKQTEEALRESEETMQYVVKHDPNAVAIYDRNLHYIAISDRYLQDYNVSEENVIGKHHYEVFPETPQRWKDVHQRCLSGAIERNDDDYFERPDGSITYNRWECRPWHRGDGTIGGIITYTEVTTERKKAEIALRESEEQFRAAFEQAAVGIAQVAPDGRFLRLNQRLCNITGYTREELLAKSFQDITHPDDLEKDLANLRRLLANEIQTSSTEKRYIRKDRPIVWVNITVSLLREPTGAPKYFVSVTEDITERRRAEEALRNREGMLQRIFDILPVGLWFADKDGKLLRGNPAGVKIWGAEPKIGPSEYGVFKARRLPSGEEVAPDDWALAHTIRDKVTVVDELLEIDAFDGKKKTILNSTAPVLDAQGNVQGAIVVNQDITERRRAEHELLQSREQMRDLAAYLESARENERTRIARELHDELGQVLTALKIDLNWIIRRMQKNDIAGRAKTNVMLGLIDDTIDTVRRLSSQLRPGLLDDMGLAAAMEWQTREFAERAGLEYELALGEEDIVLDKELTTALFRIFQESLTNVVRHAGAARIRVSLDVGPDELTMRIKDNGKGVTDGQVADPKSLGLTGMRERIRPWGGIVMFQGVAGQGTTVTVRVPHGKSPSGGAP